MIARIVLDVVQGPTRSVPLVLIGCYVAMVVLEGGVLALMGMRPVGKAFTTSFLVNMAAIATAFVMWVIVLALNASEVVLVLAVIVIPTAVQGIVLMVNRGELGKGRAWLAAVAMKLCSMLLLIGVIKLLDL